MSETKHTPTPWKIRPVGRFGFHLDSTHPGYGSAAWVEGHGDHAKQDAAFIVEAVNNYAALAASHKALVEALKEVAEAQKLYSEDRGPLGIRVITAIKDAEALTGGTK